MTRNSSHRVFVSFQDGLARRISRIRHEAHSDFGRHHASGRAPAGNELGTMHSDLASPLGELRRIAPSVNECRTCFSDRPCTELRQRASRGTRSCTRHQSGILHRRPHSVPERRRARFRSTAPYFTYVLLTPGGSAVPRSGAGSSRLLNHVPCAPVAPDLDQLRTRRERRC